MPVYTEHCDCVLQTPGTGAGEPQVVRTERAEQANYYLKTLERVLERGASFVDTELERVQKLSEGSPTRPLPSLCPSHSLLSPKKTYALLDFILFLFRTLHLPLLACFRIYVDSFCKHYPMGNVDG